MNKFLIYINRYYLFFFPLLWLIILTPLTPTLDLSIERYFYQNSQFSQHPFFQWFYQYGPWISLLFSFVCFIGLIFFKKFRKISLMLLLTFLLGSGIVVHFLLKDHWGRPRPKQIEEFGGNQEYRPYYSPNFFNQKEPSKSFPCGHCSTGFYFLALIVLGMRFKNNLLIYSGIIVGVGLGGILSLARMAQGGHFFSDTILSAIIMWYAALFCDWLVFRNYSK